MSPTTTSCVKSATSEIEDWFSEMPVSSVLLLTTLAGIVTLLALVLYQLVLYPFYLSPLRNLPGPPLGPNLIKGRFSEIINGESGIPQREWVKQYGQAIRVVGPIGLQRVIFSNSEALQKILVSGWTVFPRPAFMREILGIVTGYGLLTVTGNQHRLMRKAMNPAFSISSLMAQTDMYYDAIDGLLDILHSRIASEEKSTGRASGKVELMYEWMSKVTLDIICLSAFGYDTDSLHNPHNELASAYEDLLSLQNGQNLTRFIAILSIPGAPRLMNSHWAWKHRNWFKKIPHLVPAATLVDAMHRIKAVSASMLQEKLQEAELVESNEDTAAKKDIMSLLVRARRAEQKAREKGTRTVGAEGDPGVPYAMSDAEMMDQVLTFLGAGHETTASGLAWTLWLLANDPTSQQKLRNELAPLFDKTDTGLRKARLGYRELKDLNWLDCVVQESLRLYPPVPMTFRQAATTDYVDGVLIPKGTLFYIPIRVVNTLKEFWGEDAEEFNPSRWLSPTPAQTLTFLSGPHACIGKTMAIIEMKAVLASLIVNFEFSPAYEGQKADPTAAITMKPRDHMPLSVKKAIY